MSTPLNVVALSGGTARPSRTLALTEAILAELAQHLHIKPHLIELGEIARPLGSALWRSELPEAVEQQLRLVEKADLLVVTTPVYRGSFTGHFKHLFDLIGQDALVDTPVLLAATGGSERHALMIDHQLRPLFSFFQARTLPLGVYATDKDFLDYRLHDEALIQRSQLAVQRALPLLELNRHAQAAAAAVAAA